jgi:hypothetical protein
MDITLASVALELAFSLTLTLAMVGLLALVSRYGQRSPQA